MQHTYTLFFYQFFKHSACVHDLSVVSTVVDDPLQNAFDLLIFRTRDNIRGSNSTYKVWNDFIFHA